VASIAETPPAAIREELTRLRRQLGRDIPKKTDRNLLIATWNLREFGDLTTKWDSASRYPKAISTPSLHQGDRQAIDVVAIREVKEPGGAARDARRPRPGRSSSPTGRGRWATTGLALPDRSRLAVTGCLRAGRPLQLEQGEEAQDRAPGSPGRQFAAPCAVSFKRRSAYHPVTLPSRGSKSGRTSRRAGLEPGLYASVWCRFASTRLKATGCGGAT
jgi:hypothetical protein